METISHCGGPVELSIDTIELIGSNGYFTVQCERCYQDIRVDESAVRRVLGDQTVEQWLAQR